MIIFKNIFSFILTFYAYDWIIDGGIEPTLIAVASIQVVICALSIPMCMLPPPAPPSVSLCLWLPCRVLRFLTSFSPLADIWGKRCRAFFHRHDLLAMTRLR